MKKTVWISFFVALVVVNGLAEAMNYFAGVQVAMVHRLAFVLSITLIAIVFAGSIMLMGALTAERPLSGRFRPQEALACLQSRKMRCTYGAMAELLGIQPREVGRILGPKRPAASWVVSAATLQPTGYNPNELHPDLFQNQRVIESAEELKQLIYDCRK